MMRASPPRGLLQRLALGMLAFALVVLGLRPTAFASDASCACPCDRAQEPGSGDVARRPSCCPSPDERVDPMPVVAPGPDAGVVLVATPLDSGPRVALGPQPERVGPNVRGPPPPPPAYLLHRSLLL